MSKKIAIHSYKQGVGRTSLLAHLATMLAVRGRRVCIIDSLSEFPGLHYFFGISNSDIRHLTSYNEYAAGKCSLRQAVHEVTAGLPAPVAGQIFLVPSNSIDNSRARYEGVDSEQFNAFIDGLDAELNPDFLLADAGYSISELNLLSVAYSDLLLLAMRPDQQDFQGTAVMLEVARKLGLTNIRLIVNQAPAGLDYQKLQAHVEKIYNCPLAAILPFIGDLWAIDGPGQLDLLDPEHPFPPRLARLVTQIETTV